MTINTNKPIQIDLITDRLVNRTIQQIQSKQLSSSHKQIEKEIQALAPEHLKIFVDTVIASITKEKEALQLLEKFSNLLNLSQLEEATKLKFPELKSAIDTAKKMKPSASCYLETQKNDAPLLSPTRIKLNHAAEHLFSLLEGFLDLFGLTSIFDSTQNPETRAKKMIVLFGLVSTICAALIPVIGASHGFLAIGMVTIALISFSALYPSIRPMPHSLPRMENWSKKYREGSLSMSHCSSDALDLLASAVESNQHSLILGKPGVGKTTLAKALVREIEQGKYPNLKGKQVFYVNTGKLDNDSLNQISQMMGRHRNNIILVFDNIHQAFNGNGSLGAKLAEMIESQSHFPHIIGITTNENYRAKIANESTFSNHFSLLRVANMAPSQSKIAVQHASSKLTPLLIQEKTVSSLPRKIKPTLDPNISKPNTALGILSACKHKTSPAQISPLDKKMKKVREQLHSLATQTATQPSSSLLPYTRRSNNRMKTGKHEKLNESSPLRNRPQSKTRHANNRTRTPLVYRPADAVKHLQAKMEKLQEQKQKELTERAQFFALKKQIPLIKKKILELADQLDEQSSDKEKKVFLLLSHYFAEAFEKELRSEAKRLGLKTELNTQRNK